MVFLVLLCFIKGLTYYDAQLLILSKGEKRKSNVIIYLTRKIIKYTIEDFQLNLSHETWEQVFDGDEVNKILTLF